MPKNRQNPKKVLIFQKKCCKIKIVSRDGAVWSARLAHNQEVVGSNPTPATMKLNLQFGDIFIVKIYLNANYFTKAQAA